KVNLAVKTLDFFCCYRDPDLACRSVFCLIGSMGVGKEKDKYVFYGMKSMETKILKATVLVLVFLIITSQMIPFAGFSTRSCRYLAGKFLQQELSLDNISKFDNIGITSPVAEEENKKRVFLPYGTAAYLFIQMGAYRGGENTFSVVGLASKPLHVYGMPGFECEWIPRDSTLRPVKGKAYKMLPDWGYGRIYTVVVVNCTFSQGVGNDGGGGELVLHAHHGAGGAREPERIVALTEKENAYNQTVYTAAPPFDYLYCGSSLYGDLSPQRMREWMAYHAKFFGPRSHFVFHDAGGVHSEVRKVLEPWMQAGRVTLQDITEQEQFDGYYHNQFLIVNDCLHRYRFMANWTFFFDVDEFLYIPGGMSVESVVHEFSNYTQFVIDQYPMSNKLCLQANDSNIYSSEWGFEKLVFRDVKKGIRRDRKYAVQARNVQATGVHMSVNFLGKKKQNTTNMIRYYHYRDTVSSREEPCKEFVNLSMKEDITWLEGTPYIYDATLEHLASTIKQFELQQIGSRLAFTPQ
ncbi:hypothetical protein KI387_025065, partial [Taxus chinensis]